MKPEQVKQMADRLKIASKWKKCNHCGKYPTTTRVLGKKMEEAAEALLALLDENLRLREALDPFVRFAENNVVANPYGFTGGIWIDGSCCREQIVDWFGPSDFHAARTAALHPAPEKEERDETL